MSPIWSSSFNARKWQENSQYNNVLKFFEKSGFSINDVSNNKEYFGSDIDFWIMNEQYNVSVELKVDSKMNRSHNFFFEIISNEEKSTPWCFLICKADIFLYYDAISHTWYFFPTKKLQKWFFDVRKKYSDRSEFNNSGFITCTHTTYDDGSYKHTTVWRALKVTYVLWSLKKMWIPYFTKDILNDSISNQDIANLFS